MGLTSHQGEKLEECINILKTSNRLVLKGSAGVGKTYLLDTLIKRFSKNFKNQVCCTAPTNKAVAVMKQKITPHSFVQFNTTHSALKLSRKIDYKTGDVSFVPYKGSDRYPPLLNVRFLIIDEASMLSSIMLNNVEHTATDRGAIVIFVGDEKQLNPVNELESPVFKAGYPTVELTEIVRQGEGNPIISLSRNLKLTNKPVDNVITTDGLTGYLFSKNKEKIIHELAEINGTDEYKYLAWTNREVDSMNKVVRERIYGSNPRKIEEGETLIFNSPFGKNYSTNQEIKVKKLAIINRDFEFMYDKDGDNDSEYEDWKKTKKINLKCYLINDEIPVLHEEAELDYKKVVEIMKSQRSLAKISWKDIFEFKEQFGDLTYNHAITVHKSQGSTYKNAIINLKNLNFNKNTEERKKLLYTAITRASDLVVFYNY